MSRPTENLEALTHKLCEASQAQYVNPYQELSWPETLEESAWCFSPELLSLYGIPRFDTLPEATQKKLSFWETVNFFSLNIHGERALMEGLAARLYKKAFYPVSAYLHHFLDEENKHMVYFGGFCNRYAGKIYSSRTVTFPRDYAPGELDFLFFAQVMIFEEIVDVYNIKMSQDSRLPEIIREINRYHHRDEARHLSFGRLLVRDLFHQHAEAWPPEVLVRVREQLKHYFLKTWKEFYNPDVYRDCGLEDPYTLMDEAFDSASARKQRRDISAKCMTYLLDTGILEEDPL